MEDIEISCITSLRNIISFLLSRPNDYFLPAQYRSRWNSWSIVYIFIKLQSAYKGSIYKIVSYEIADIEAIDNWLQLVKLIESISGYVINNL